MLGHLVDLDLEVLSIDLDCTVTCGCPDGVVFNIKAVVDSVTT